MFASAPHSIPAHEGAAHGHHDALLREDVVLLLRLDDVALAEALEGEGPGGVVAVLHELYPPEAAHAQGGDDVQVV